MIGRGVDENCDVSVGISLLSVRTLSKLRLILTSELCDELRVHEFECSLVKKRRIEFSFHDPLR